MASKNRHWKSLWLEDNSFKKCRKRSCTGTLISCAVTYKPNSPIIHQELECSDCGNVTRDPRYSPKYRKLYQQQDTTRFNNKPRYNNR